MDRRQFTLFAIAALAAACPAQAADWPTRTVTIVNPFAAGGMEVAARAIAQAMTVKFGQPFIVENRAGAGGTVGSVSVAKAAPDGYTLLLSAIGPAVLNQLLFKSVPYDTDKDFAPIVLVGEFAQLIVSDPKLGFKTLQDLVEFGRKNPGKLNIGHPGAGSMGHLTGALFLARTSIQGSLIGYRGAVPIVTDVMGGQIQAGIHIFIPAVSSVTVLAVTGEQRIPFLPDIPTARESGVDLTAGTWVAMMAPAGLPRDIVTKLNTAINQFLASPEGVQHLTNAGLRPMGGTPDDLLEVIRQDRARWAPIIKKENIQVDQN